MPGKEFPNDLSELNSIHLFLRMARSLGRLAAGYFVTAMV
jgi:hypothetical protein